MAGALDARDASGGVIDSVTDDEILDAYRIMASKEGIFCEPASAASLAGLIKLHKGGLDLSRKAAALAGGKNGKVIVAGKAAESRLWRRVLSNEMPKGQPALSAS